MAAGIRTRHARSCRQPAGRCNCQPSYEAWAWSERDAKKIRRTFPTLADAKAWRADADRAVRRGAMRSPKPTTLAQAAAEWLDGARAGTIPNRSGDPYKPSALRSYEQALRDRVLPALGHHRLADLARADVQDFADRLTAQGLSASTVQNTIDPLRVVCGRALRRDLLTIDPTQGLELRRPRGRRDRIASPQEATELLGVLPAFEHALWATALYSGLRRGELRALRFADIDHEERIIRVRRGWDDHEGVIEAKTAAGRRDVPLIGRLGPILAAHRLAAGGTPDALVFALSPGRPFYPATVRRHALNVWGAHGLEPIGLHEARHTFASLMIAAGVNAKALSTFMGHANIAMTFDVYGHLMPNGGVEARERIDSYLARLDGAPALHAV
jgi:integrase